MTDPLSVQKADARARRHALLWLTAIALAGTASIVFTERWLSAVAGAIDVPSARASVATALWWTLILASACPIGLGAYAWRLSTQVRVARRFPPPGQAVIRDTTILEGPAAVQRANALRAVGAALIVAGITLLAAVGSATTLGCMEAVLDTRRGGDE